MTLNRELEIATHLAQRAGDVVMRHHNTDLQVDSKQNDEPVTAADRESEQVILEDLRREFPDDGILAEESAQAAPWRPGGRNWIVDPLDGTKDFVARLEGFSVMIGLLIGDRPALGVVCQPRTGVTFRGVVGQSAEMLSASSVTPMAVSTRTRFDSLRLVVSNSHRSPGLDRVKQALGIHDELRYGSVGLKASFVARGERDLYVHPSGRCKLWDCCAPEAILAAAGGTMTDLFGDPLLYEPEQVLIARGILASNGACHDALVQQIAPLFSPTDL